MLAILVFFLGCYLVGSIPTGYLVVKAIKRIDIRTVGSGNLGATNVLRTAGLWAGAIVLNVDVLKGLVASSFIPRWGQLLSPTAALLCGAAAILGHNFPCWLNFRGGKGVATTLGVFLGHTPGVALAFVLVWLVAFAITRFVSVASVLGAVAIPITQSILRRSPGEIAIGAALAVLIVWRHRANLQRLLSGTEHRFRK